MRTTKKEERKAEPISKSQLITEMSSKNGELTIKMDLTKPTKKTFRGFDMYSTQEVALCGKNEELVVKIFAIKRPLPERRFQI